MRARGAERERVYRVLYEDLRGPPRGGAARKRTLSSGSRLVVVYVPRAERERQESEHAVLGGCCSLYPVYTVVICL